MAPAGPGEKKKLFQREPLKLTRWHPSRMEAAMKLDGASEEEVARAVAGHLGAAAQLYREDPRNSPVPPPPTPTGQPHADPPEDAPAATTATATGHSGGDQ
jgi:hypothetical protein